MSPRPTAASGVVLYVDVGVGTRGPEGVLRRMKARWGSGEAVH